MNRTVCVVLVSVATAAMTGLTTATAEDDFTNVVRRAAEHYQNGRLSDAERQLQLALQMIRDRRAVNLAACLPSGLPGWSVEQSSSKSSDMSLFGIALLGNSATASRSFTRGNSRVECLINSDAPLLQQFAAIINSPLLSLGESSRLEQINGEVARVTYDENERKGELFMIVGSRYLIHVKGTDVARDDVIAFARKFDFATLGELR